MTGPCCEPVLAQILDLLDTACQASLELMDACGAGDITGAQELLDGMRAAVDTVRSAQKPLLPLLEHAYTAEMLENIEDTLDEITRSMGAEQHERAAMKMEYQLFPFLRQLKESFYFWGAVYPDPAQWQRYCQEEFAAHYQNFYVSGGARPRYRASVVVVAYNHLEMTKQCVESVLRDTDFEALNAELVLVDHGSSDDVLEYFERLGVGRVIHYKANMRGTMFCALPQICDSEYYVHVANDTVVTKNWLDILLSCMDSDPKIALAVPATCNISNYQNWNVPTSDCKKLLKLAAAHNRSNPRLWNDRARVLPPIGVFRIRTLNEIGFWDPYFYTFDFMDDDFSLRARRNGFRQVLCEDVMCYHRGSATIKEEQRKENTLTSGGALFRKKHSVDAWGTGCCYDAQIMRMMDTAGIEGGAVNLLGIDCGFGDTVLQMCNQLRREGREASIYHITTDAAYLPDLLPQSKEAVYIPREALPPALGECFPGVRFSCVCVGKELNDYPEPMRLLDGLSRRMEEKQQLFCSFKNPFFAVTLNQMLKLSLPESPMLLLPPERIRLEAERLFSKVELSGTMQEIQGLDGFMVRHYGTPGKADLKNRLKTRLYYIKCVK